MSKIVIEKRSLRYDFSAVELHDLSLQLAKKNKEVVSLEEEKKAVTSQLAAKIKEADATVNILSEKVASGFEYREIECDVIFHKPQQGKKTTPTGQENNCSPRHEQENSGGIHDGLRMGSVQPAG